MAQAEESQGGVPMKASVNNKRGVAIVSFEGQLSFAHTLKLKEKLQELYTEKKNKKIIFNLEKLEFVGSSGIKPFIKTLRTFNKETIKPRVCGLSAEYQKLFSAFEGRDKFEIFENENAAIRSYLKTGNA